MKHFKSIQSVCGTFLMNVNYCDTIKIIIIIIQWGGGGGGGGGWWSCYAHPNEVIANYA